MNHRMQNVHSPWIKIKFYNRALKEKRRNKLLFLKSFGNRKQNVKTLNVASISDFFKCMCLHVCVQVNTNVKCVSLSTHRLTQSKHLWNHYCCSWHTHSGKRNVCEFPINTSIFFKNNSWEKLQVSIYWLCHHLTINVHSPHWKLEES